MGTRGRWWMWSRTVEEMVVNVTVSTAVLIASDPERRAYGMVQSWRNLSLAALT